MAETADYYRFVSCALLIRTIYLCRASAHASVLVQQNKGLLACSSIIDTHTHLCAGWLATKQQSNASSGTNRNKTSSSL
jgi:hypothetical protein